MLAPISAVDPQRWLWFSNFLAAKRPKLTADQIQATRKGADVAGTAQEPKNAIEEAVDQVKPRLGELTQVTDPCYVLRITHALADAERLAARMTRETGKTWRVHRPRLEVHRVSLNRREKFWDDSVLVLQGESREAVFRLAGQGKTGYAATREARAQLGKDALLEKGAKIDLNGMVYQLVERPDVTPERVLGVSSPGPPPRPGEAEAPRLIVLPEEPGKPRWSS